MIPSPSGRIAKDNADLRARLAAAERDLLRMTRAKDHWLGQIRNWGERIHANRIIQGIDASSPALPIIKEIADYVPAPKPSE